MALTGTCTVKIGSRICGERISEKAKTCQNCGSDGRKKANNEAQAQIEKTNREKGFLVP